MYEIHNFHFSDQNARDLLGLLKAAFPRTNIYDNAYLHWQYAQNPWGPPIAFNAYCKAKLVAHYAVLPVEVDIGDTPYPAALSLNTATHPEHQGKGLFTRLAETTYEEAARQDKRIVIGVANAQSTPGFIKRLGFTLLGPLGARLTLGLGPRLKVSYGMRRHWTQEGLSWRLSNPRRTYFSRMSRKQETYLAPSERFGILVLLGSSPFSSPVPLSSPPLLRNPVNVWIGLESEYERRGGLMNIPQNFRPSPLNFIVKRLAANVEVPAREEVLFQALDFDAY